MVGTMGAIEMIMKEKIKFWLFWDSTLLMFLPDRLRAKIFCKNGHSAGTWIAGANAIDMCGYCNILLYEDFKRGWIEL